MTAGLHERAIAFSFRKNRDEGCGTSSITDGMKKKKYMTSYHHHHDRHDERDESDCLK